MNAEANILLFPYLQLYLLSTGSDKGCEQDGRTGRSCGTEDSIEIRGNHVGPSSLLSVLQHFPQRKWGMAAYAAHAAPTGRCCPTYFWVIRWIEPEKPMLYSRRKQGPLPPSHLHEHSSLLKLWHRCWEDAWKLERAFVEVGLSPNDLYLVPNSKKLTGQQNLGRILRTCSNVKAF